MKCEIHGVEKSYTSNNICPICEVNRQREEEAKPVPVQSADMTLIEIEIALDRALHFKVNDMSDDTIGAYESWRQEKLKDFRRKLESFAAAQRQAGREEALDIYNDALVVMDIRHAELITCYARLEEAAKCVQREKAECSEVSTQAWDAIDEALDELDEAKGGK